MARPPNPEAPHRLVQAARREFASKGVDAARVEDIAKAAGFSKAAFYLYFENKEALYAQLVTGLFQKMEAISAERHAQAAHLVEQIGAVSESDWRTGSERWRAFHQLDHRHTVAALQVLWNERDIVACILDHATGPRRTIIDTFIDWTKTTLSGRLREAMQFGVVRADVDRDLASEIIVGIYLQIGRRMVRLSEPPDFDHWARVLDAFISEGMGCKSKESV